MTDGEFRVKRRRSKRRPNRSWPKVITGLNAVVKQAMARSRCGPLARLAVSLVRGRRNYLSCALGGEAPSCNLSSVGPRLLQTGGIWMGRRVQLNVAQLQSCPATIPAGRVALAGDLTVPPAARGLVIFAHGSGSSRRSPRNQSVARHLHSAGLSTLLFDLLTEQEERLEYHTRHLRFDIPLLGERLVNATHWAGSQTSVRGLSIGYFGASTGAAAALVAAAELPDRIGAVVSRGGRPDLAGKALPEVKAATLLIVGGHDTPAIELNEQAHAALRCEKRLIIVPRATHLFEEPGTLERVAHLAAEWFLEHLAPSKIVQP